MDSNNRQARLMVNNMVFKCQPEGKYFNVLDTQIYAVNELVAFVTDPKTGQTGPFVQTYLMCENCWKKYQKEWGLKEPTKIITAANIPQGMKEKINGKGPF